MGSEETFLQLISQQQFLGEHIRSVFNAFKFLHLAFLLLPAFFAAARQSFAALAEKFMLCFSKRSANFHGSTISIMKLPTAQGGERGLINIIRINIIGT